MPTVSVPAFERVRVASSFAKRMKVTVLIEVVSEDGSEPTGPQVPGAPEVLGLLEVEKRLVPFLPPERSEQPLVQTQRIGIGAWYPVYAVYVTATRPLTLQVTLLLKLHRWVLVAAAVAVGAVCIIVAVVLLQMTR